MYFAQEASSRACMSRATAGLQTSMKECAESFMQVNEAIDVRDGR